MPATCSATGLRPAHCHAPAVPPGALPLTNRSTHSDVMATSITTGSRRSAVRRSFQPGASHSGVLANTSYPPFSAHILPLMCPASAAAPVASDASWAVEQERNDRSVPRRCYPHSGDRLAHPRPLRWTTSASRTQANRRCAPTTTRTRGQKEETGNIRRPKFDADGCAPKGQLTAETMAYSSW